MPISAPYRFVPLSKAIVAPDWSTQASHDVPFEDGLSGELHIELTAHTDLCIGGRQDKADETHPGRVHFYRDPDGNPAIPGSSIKGMLRNVLEIAGFGCFHGVQDKALGVRDITKRENFYFDAMGKSTQAGWLRFESGIWSIHPCTYSRVLQSDIIAECCLNPEGWKKLGKAKDRYARLGVFRTVRFDIETSAGDRGSPLAKPASDGQLSGHIVVTGQPGPDYTRPDAKKKEFVFHDGAGPALQVPDDVMSGFRQIYQDSDEWRFWMDKLGADGLTPGIPVFFNSEAGHVRSLGLSLMYKLPYKLGLHQAIANTSPGHLDGNRMDLARLVFGHIDETGNDSLRGRVAVGMASAVEHGPLQWSTPTVLNGPKANYYPTYIRQRKQTGGDWNQLMKADAELSGWKRYPLKPVDVLPPPPKAGTKVQVRLETVPAGSRFAGKIRFHNLRFVELGALLWVLTLPSSKPRTVHRHNIGMGKPLGLGQIGITVTGLEYRLNNPGSAGEASGLDLQHACIKEFERFMDASLGGSWLQSGPMQALLEYMTPDALRPDDLRYMEVKSFGDNKRDLENAIAFHQWQGIEQEATPDKFTPDLSASLDAARSLQEALRKKSEFEERKRDASDEQVLLIELDELLEKPSGKTTFDSIESRLRTAWETLVQFEGDDRFRLLELAAKADKLDKKAISKVCKKILAS